MLSLRKIRRRFEEQQRKLRKRPKLLTLTFYWKLITAPINALLSGWNKPRTRDLILGIPSIVTGIAVLYLVGRAKIEESRISVNYLDAAKRAVVEGRDEEAELLLRRVIQRGDSNVSDAKFSMALLYEKTERKGEASVLFSELAPDESRGNADAHKRLAFLLASEINTQSPEADKTRLHWHLVASNDRTSPMACMAWGRYFLATGDLAQAEKNFQLAVDQFPALWCDLGEIQVAFGRTEKAIASYRRAAAYLATELQKSPKDAKNRVDYAQTLLRLGDFVEARKVLEAGKTQRPDGPWNWLLATLEVSLHDLLVKQNASVSELLAHIRLALSHDPEHQGALKRLMSYATAEVEGNEELRTILARVIAEGKEPAMAHLAMGNLCWLEGDSSTAAFHFEQALSMKKDMAVVLNNLAWMIAHDERQPDLERALALVNAALEQRPGNTSFLDTRGKIYFLQENWKAALTDFETTLKQGGRDPRPVHQHLAKIYDELGHKEIAEQHRLLAAEVVDSGP
ncbi:tetratricopeptide repeat protein [Fuerstiella marisgermanici]|uniref:Putative PEP-CTERM system TPR-repeat lipoprotein n=1 Tax=Fuerstiella marisgermanici TaxID=1891926 RepID=A0A1P8WPC6_9PLAN|nr:tetratricopeptide repeat protein [Fuerstiella marisgermanici]APZ95917.1 putative PEP-CTERM system TPR-repeat lipoprotein [Fuerstiella marisgermanici]